MIKILDYTKKPLTLMGEVASTCWNSTPSPQIGVDCIESGHGRVLEFADVTVAISDYSARVIRELYTSIIGVSRLQQSTRYVDMSSFDYYIPPRIKDTPVAKQIYDECMVNTMESYTRLRTLGIPKEDMANLVPLGSNTKIVLKINARAILHMAEIRLCNRALLEYRELMKDILFTVSDIDSEWNKLISYAKPRCEISGYCNEKHSCGKHPTRNEVGANEE